MIYDAIRGSGNAELGDSIDNLTLDITVKNIGVIPSGPSILTIGDGLESESIYYKSIDGNKLIGVVRGYGGSTARSWDAGTSVRRTLTSVEWNKIVDKIYNRNLLQESIIYNLDGRVERVVQYIEFPVKKYKENKFHYVGDLLTREEEIWYDIDGISVLYHFEKEIMYDEYGRIIAVEQAVK